MHANICIAINYVNIFMSKVSFGSVFNFGTMHVTLRRQLTKKIQYTLQYSHTFINSISWLHLPTFGSQAAIVSEKIGYPYVFWGNAAITLKIQSADRIFVFLSAGKHHFVGRLERLH